MNLSDLAKSPINKMERGDLIAHILQVRSIRRLTIKAKGTKVSSPRAKPVKEKKSKDLISMLSPEQAAALYEQLMDGEETEENE